MTASGSLLQRVDINSLCRFVLKRHQADGGFAATPMLAHTIADTWSAGGILLALRPLLPSEEIAGIFTHQPTREYLASFAARPHAVSARIKFQLVMLLQQFAVQADQLPPVGMEQQTFRSFEEFYYLAKLGEVESSVTPLPEGSGFLALELPTVRDCYFYLLWQQEFQHLPDQGSEERVQLVAWLTAAQNRDGGFGFYPGTTSYVENSFFALAALNLLQAGPENGVRAAQFILSCQTGGGGFARNPSAAPFLEDSLSAVKALALLDHSPS